METVRDGIKADNAATGVQSVEALVNGTAKGHSRKPSAKTNGRTGPPPIAPKPLSLSSKPLDPIKGPTSGLKNGRILVHRAIRPSVDTNRHTLCEIVSGLDIEIGDPETGRTR
jgi:hypothetical protein